MGSVGKLIRKDIEHFGLAKTVYDLSTKAINRCVYFKIFIAMKIETVHPDYLETEDRFQWQFFKEDQLRELAKKPEYNITPANLQNARDKGDECYGALDGDKLACYGWYSNEPTEAAEGLMLHFNPDYVYMYRGFTHPDYRGKRLHAIGMNRALREYLLRDYKGLVSSVESNNFSSLQSVYRMGYRNFGRIAVLKIGNHPLMHTSRGCRDHGFFLTTEEAPGVAEPALTA